VQEGLLDLCFYNKKINFERYVQVILGQFFPGLTNEERLYGWFQQDSATACTAFMSIQALSNLFGDRIISSGIWPAHSPNLNSCNFLLLGLFVEDKVYNSNPRTEERLKQNIHREIANIPAEQLRRVNQNSSACARNVYVYRDCISNTSCDL
jgi:hypothetical protein